MFKQIKNCFWRSELHFVSYVCRTYSKHRAENDKLPRFSLSSSSSTLSRHLFHVLHPRSYPSFRQYKQTSAPNQQTKHCCLIIQQKCHQQIEKNSTSYKKNYSRKNNKNIDKGDIRCNLFKFKNELSLFFSSRSFSRSDPFFRRVWACKFFSSFVLFLFYCSLFIAIVFVRSALPVNIILLYFCHIFSPSLAFFFALRLFLFLLMCVCLYAVWFILELLFVQQTHAYKTTLKNKINKRSTRWENRKQN